MIYFVRHGESESNVNQKMGGMWAFEVDVDSPLTEVGREQARETAEKLKGKKIDVVVTSGLVRAKDTAEIINRYHGAPVVEM